MSEGAGNRIPKTLADVSHLFFSTRVEEDAPAASRGGNTTTTGEERPAAPAHAAEHAAQEARPRAAERTRIVVVTGGDDAPGKSTVAVNLAHGLLRWGSVGLFDADPRLPNARFYLGLPSWQYLSPLTGDGRPSPAAALDSGLVVVDWTPDATDASELARTDGSVQLEIGGASRRRLDYAVVDVPVGRLRLLHGCARRISRFVVVASPGWDGFAAACGAASRLSTVLGARAVDLVVNRAPDETYAAAYHRKFGMAARDVLSVEARLLAGVGRYTGLGCEQRERGPLVRSRPDVAPALALRNAASSIAGSQPVAECAGARHGARMERACEDENPEIGAA